MQDTRYEKIQLMHAHNLIIYIYMYIYTYIYTYEVYLRF